MTEATTTPQPDDERESRPPADEGQAMRSLRRAHIRSLVKSGQVPRGYRVNEDGTSLVKTGNPAWPERPLDPNCHDYGEANGELAKLVRQRFPDFDPDSDRRWWLQVAEMVRRAGREAAEIAQMRHDDLVAFFRFEALHREGQQGAGGRDSISSADVAVGASVTPRTAVPDGPATTGQKETTRTILRRMLSDKVGRAQLMAAGSAEEVGRLIGRSGSTVKETQPEWKELCELFEIQRTNRRVVREIEDGRRG